MVDQQLITYIAQQLQQGVSREQIASTLIAEGWQERDISEVFTTLSDNSVSVPPQQRAVAMPGAFSLLNQAWSLYISRLGTFLGIMIIPTLISFGIVAIFAGGLFGSVLVISKSVAVNVSLMIISAVLFIVTVFISQIWGVAALLYAIKDNSEGIGVLEAYRRSRRKIHSYAWVGLLTFAIVMGGFILLIVPGIIFLVWFSLAGFILIGEDVKGMAALLKSKAYIKGNWGGIFWRMIFMMTLALVVSLVAGTLFGVVKAPYIEEIGRIVLPIFLTPLMMSYSFLVYSNLRNVTGAIAFVPTGGQKATFGLIAVIGILIPVTLSALTFLGLDAAREKARDVFLESEMRQIQLGLSIYYDDYESYPSSLRELVPQYLSESYTDPTTLLPYDYQRIGNDDYQVCAQSEVKGQICISSQF